MIEKISLPTPEADGSTTRVKDDPVKLRSAAAQFEALLLGQMLKSMRESNGWLGTEEDHASSSAMEFAQEMFAQSLSASGGLGLARTVVDGLSRESGS